MAALSAAAAADFIWVRDYIVNSNGLERPFLDDKAREVIGRHYAELGYTDQIKFLEDLNAQPVLTFIKIAIALGVAQ